MRDLLTKTLLKERLQAFITDIFMIYMPILYITTYVILGSKEKFLSSNIAPFVCFVIYMFIISLLFCKSSQTLGYRYARIYLIKDGENLKQSHISFLRALVRFLCFCFSIALIFGVFFPLLRKDRRFFHDIISCTNVIKIEN